MKPEDKDERVDTLFDGLAPPAPPQELRARVLAATRSATAARPVSDLWTRIWENRILRIAWAASVFSLVVGHVVLEPLPPSPQRLAAEQSMDDEMAEFLRPVRIEESVCPNLGRLRGCLDPLIDPDNGGNAL